jgi:hypothetical protein
VLSPYTATSSSSASASRSLDSEMRCSCSRGSAFPRPPVSNSGLAGGVVRAVEAAEYDDPRWPEYSENSVFVDGEAFTVRCDAGLEAAGDGGAPENVGEAADTGVAITDTALAVVIFVGVVSSVVFGEVALGVSGSPLSMTGKASDVPSSVRDASVADRELELFRGRNGVVIGAGERFSA